MKRRAVESMMDLTDAFAEIRARVTPEQAARFYGLEPNRAGYCRCPFHGPERTPSLKLYADGWHCFGCGAGGDVTALVGRLHGLTPLDAARKINVDFGLRLPLDGPVSPQEREQARAEREKSRRSAAALDAWRSETLDRLAACIGVSINALRRGDWTVWTPVEAEAVRREPEIEDLYDELNSADKGRWLEVLGQREEVDKLCRSILTP